MKKCCAFLTGIVVGAVVTALVTPKTGKEMQDELIKKVNTLQKKVKEFDIKEVNWSEAIEDTKCAIKGKLDDAKHAIEEFDWDTSKQKVQEKFDDVAERLNEIKRQLAEGHEAVAEAQSSGESDEEWQAETPVEELSYQELQLETSVEEQPATEWQDETQTNQDWQKAQAEVITFGEEY